MDDDLNDDARLVALRSLKIDSIALQVIGTLERSSISPLLMKGPVTQKLHPEGSVRSYSDIDLLVEPTSFARAGRALRGLGFKRLREGLLPSIDGMGSHSQSWVRIDGAAVDLHHSLPLTGADPSTTWEVIKLHRETISLGGRSIQILDEAAQAFQIAVHVVQHPESAKHAADLNAAISRLDLRTWQAAYEIASALEGTNAFLSGLFSSPRAQSLTRTIGLPSEDAPFVAPAGSRGFDWMGEQLAIAPGLGGRLGLIRGALYPPPKFMRRVSSLARRGTVGLALAYLIRPFILVARLGPALRHWFDSRRREKERGAD